MGLLSRFGREIKAIADVPFSRWGAFGQGDGGLGYTSSRDIAYLYTTNPGAGYDYLTAAGNLAENSVVAAISEAVARALPDAPPFLEVKNSEDKWEPFGPHPVIDFLNWPNGGPDNSTRGYSSAHLWASTIRSEYTNGNGFWRLKFNGSGEPVEAWWEAFMAPRYDGQNFVKDYRMIVDGRPYYLDVRQVIHFRLALNPYNPRWGYTPLYTATRHVDGDNQAASFHTAILRNGGVGSYAISLKNADDYAKAGITPKQLKAQMEKWDRKLRGEGAGKSIDSSLPISVEKIGYSPEDLVLDKLVAYYESRICAVLGVPAMVVGVTSGEATKTYSNYGEALKDFWIRTIKPLNALHSMELGTQLLPLFGLSPADYRINWDYSQVAALQEGMDEVHTRARANFQADGITLAEFRQQIGMPPDDTGLYDMVWYSGQNLVKITHFDEDDSQDQETPQYDEDGNIIPPDENEEDQGDNGDTAVDTGEDDVPQLGPGEYQIKALRTPKPLPQLAQGKRAKPYPDPRPVVPKTAAHRQPVGTNGRSN